MQKMPCQPIRSVRAPPMIGAVTGATPLIAPITASMRPSSAPENLSVATEREMTMPPDAATPWMNRMVTNCSMLCAVMQSTVDTRKSAMAASSGLRRPYLSLNGPKKSCPTASPIMLVVSPIWTIDDEVAKNPAIEGSVGRYMSVTKGPKAVSMPSRISRKSRELSCCMCLICF